MTHSSTNATVPVGKPAGMGVRSWAYLIDWHIRVVLSLVFYILLIYFGRGAEIHQIFSNQASIETLFTDPNSILFYPPALFVAFSIFVLYHPLLEYLMGGQTPGKYWAQITIVNSSGNPPNFFQIIGRNVFRFIDFIPLVYGVGLLTGLIRQDQRRLGDMVAKTYLIYTK